MVQVAGSLNTPAYRWPLHTGITCCVLSPIAYALQLLDWNGWGRLRLIVVILKFLGPIGLLAIGLVSLIFALAVRQARNARRRDLEDLSTGFALIDRRGRREYRDEEVVALGVRSRMAASGTVSTQKGQATLFVEGFQGTETIALAWEYPDGSQDPLGEFLGRLADGILARSLRTIDSGGTIEGDGWSLSRPGLQVGDASETIPFGEIAVAEHHDAQLQVWKVGETEPFFKVPEGSTNEVILHAVLNHRKSTRVPTTYQADPSTEALGRVLFERRPKGSEKFAMWVLGLIIAAVLGGIALFSRPALGPILSAAACVVVVILSFLPAVSQQRAYFRFHERGVDQCNLFGVKTIPFEDLAEVKLTLMSYDSQLSVVFKPIKGRLRKKISVMLKPTDAALETMRAHIPDEKFRT